jgi:hypothetical protein
MLRGPPLNSRTGRWIWTGMVLVYWSLAFVIGSAIPQVQTISGLVAAVCIMQVRRRLRLPFPPLLNRRSSRTRSRSCSRGGTCTASAARPRCPRRCKRSSGRTSCCSSLRSRWRASACTAPGPRSRRRSRRARRRASGAHRPSETGVCVGGRWMADVCALVVLVSCMLFTFNAVYLPLGQSTVCDRPWPC